MKKAKWLVAIAGLSCLVMVSYYVAQMHRGNPSPSPNPIATSATVREKHTPAVENPSSTEQNAGGLDENFPTGRILILKDAVGVDLREHPTATIGGVTFYAEPVGQKKMKDDLALIADPVKKSCLEQNPGILWTDHKFTCLKIIKSFKFEPKDFRGANIYISDTGDIRAFDFITLDLTREEFEAELSKGNDPTREAYAKIQARIKALSQEEPGSGNLH